MLRRQRPLLSRLVASAFARDPTTVPLSVEEVVRAHDASGEDAAANLTRDFAAASFALVPYRIKKLGDEWRALRAAGIIASLPAAADAPLLLVRLLVIFVIGVVLGRQSAAAELAVPPTVAATPKAVEVAVVAKTEAPSSH